MIILSLFDGIGTGRLALERAGIKVDKYYASEIDTKAIKVAKENFGDIEHIGDAERIDLRKLEKIDLIIGGSPCQGFSRNGKHKNFDDPRSGLFLAFAEILEKAKEMNAEIKFMFENVKMKREWQDTITAFLEVEPITIDSRIHTAQARERTYWTNIKGVEPPKRDAVGIEDIADKQRDTKDYIKINGVWIDPRISENERSLITKVDNVIRIKQATKSGYIIAEDGDGINLSFPTSKTRRGRVIKGKLPTLDCSCNVCYMLNGAIHKLTVTEAERAQNLPTGYTRGITDQDRKKAIGNGWNEKTVRHILGYIKTTQEERKRDK